MALQDIVVMAGNRSLIERVAACAAAEGVVGPVAWAERNIWTVVAYEGFADAWEKAAADPSPNVNPNTGARTDVISDEMIQTAVRDLKTKVT